MASNEMKEVYQAQGGVRVLEALEAEIRRLYRRAKGEQT